MNKKYYEQDSKRQFIYQDNHPEIKAISTALYLKKEELGLGIKSLTDALHNIPDRYAIWMFLEGAGIDSESLNEIKKYLKWNSIVIQIGCKSIMSKSNIRRIIDFCDNYTADFVKAGKEIVF